MVSNVGRHFSSSKGLCSQHYAIHMGGVNVNFFGILCIICYNDGAMPTFSVDVVYSSPTLKWSDSFFLNHLLPVFVRLLWGSTTVPGLPVAVLLHALHFTSLRAVGASWSMAMHSFHIIYWSCNSSLTSAYSSSGVIAVCCTTQLNGGSVVRDRMRLKCLNVLI